MEASNHMLKSLSLAFLLTAVAVTASAQDKKITTADFAGTWNIEVMSHQIALVIEPVDATRVTATMMMMGRDTLLKGELTDRTLTLSGVKTETTGTPQHAPAPSSGAEHAGTTPPTPRPIVVKLLEDGTIEGEMMTTGGPAKWTGEKLRTKKKS
jgi:hypothetical protein